MRIYLVVMDETEEAQQALRFASLRAMKTGGSVHILALVPQQTFNAVADMLRSRRLCYLHVVEGDLMTGARQLDYTELKRRYGGIYMANAGYDFARATEALRTGNADLVAFGRLFLANPDLPARFALGAPLNEPDPDTFYGGDERGYTDYPPLQQ